VRPAEVVGVVGTLHSYSAGSVKRAAGGRAGEISRRGGAFRGASHYLRCVMPCRCELRRGRSFGVGLSVGAAGAGWSRGGVACASGAFVNHTHGGRQITGRRFRGARGFRGGRGFAGASLRASRHDVGWMGREWSRSGVWDTRRSPSGNMAASVAWHARLPRRRAAAGWFPHAPRIAPDSLLDTRRRRHSYGATHSRRERVSRRSRDASASSELRHTIRGWMGREWSRPGARDSRRSPRGDMAASVAWHARQDVTPSGGGMASRAVDRMRTVQRGRECGIHPDAVLRARRSFCIHVGSRAWRAEDGEAVAARGRLPLEGGPLERR
jgi:hypothetical protein